MFWPSHSTRIAVALGVVLIPSSFAHTFIDQAFTPQQRRLEYAKLTVALPDAFLNDPTGQEVSALLMTLYSYADHDFEALEALIGALRTQSRWISPNAANLLFKALTKAKGPHWVNRMRIMGALLNPAYLGASVNAQYFSERIIEGKIQEMTIPHSLESLNAALQAALWAEFEHQGHRTSETVRNLLNHSLQKHPTLRVRPLHHFMEQTDDAELIPLLPPLFDLIRATGSFENLALRLLCKRLARTLSLHSSATALGGEIAPKQKALLILGSQLMVHQYPTYGLVREFLETVLASTFLSQESRKNFRNYLAKADAHETKVTAWSFHCIDVLKTNPSDQPN